MDHGEDDFVIAPDPGGRRRWWIVAAIAAVAVLVVAGVAFAISRRPPNQPLPSKPVAIEPAQVTTAQAPAVATPTVPATQAAEPTSTPPGSSVAESGTSSVATQTSSFAHAPYMGFRLNGVIYLAREDGVKAIPLVTTDGVYALSPDARSLAYVDPAKRRLSIVDLSTQTTVTVGPARQVTPEWAPDSSWVLGVRDSATSHATEVFRVDRTTGAARTLGPAAMGAVSPNGGLVALVPPAGSGSDRLRLVKDGKTVKDLASPAPLLDAVLGTSQAFVATTGSNGAGKDEGVWSLGFNGDLRLLSTSASAGQPGDFGSLSLSPDGRYLAYARIGDDGRSRMSIVKTSGGAPVTIQPRRDVYPLWWAADSSALYAIEGNSFQGETTALIKVTPDGRKETVVVKGADL